MKSRINESSKVILTLVVALLVFYFFHRNIYLLAAAITIGSVGILFASVAHKIALAWMWLAGLISKIMPKVVLGVLYFLFFVPYAFVYRIFKKDPLVLKNREMKTLYKERNHTYSPADLENPW